MPYRLERRCRKCDKLVHVEEGWPWTCPNCGSIFHKKIKTYKMEPLKVKTYSELRIGKTREQWKRVRRGLRVKLGPKWMDKLAVA